MGIGKPVIFLAFANDKLLSLEKLEEERKTIFNHLSHLVNQNHFQVITEPSATIEDIYRTLIELKNRIVLFHYGGHTNGEQIFLKDQGGNAEGIANALAVQENLQLVFLNGCSSEQQVETLLDLGVPAVIATSSAIPDQAAMEFADTFYHAFTRPGVNGHSLLESFNLAQSRIKASHNIEFSVFRDLAGSRQNPEGDPSSSWGLYINEQKNSSLGFKLNEAFARLWETNDTRKSYYEKLLSYYDENTFSAQERLTLREIYVEPSFKIYHSIFRERGREVELRDETGFIDIQYLLDFYSREEQFRSIHEFLVDYLYHDTFLDISHQPKFILLLGYPGQGKTSFCRRLLYDLITSGLEKEDIFYLPFRTMTQTDTLFKNPIVALKEEAEIRSQMDLQQNEFINSLLILDGLDELPVKEGAALEFVDTLCLDLIRESEKRNLNIIVTSRYGCVDIERLKNENVLIIQLKEFDFELQKEWLSRYNSITNQSTWLDEKKLALFHNRQDTAEGAQLGYIRELIQQPILLKLIASLPNPIQADSSKVEVYYLVLDEIATNVIKNFNNVRKDDLLRLIQEIGFAVFLSGNNTIDRNKLLQLDCVKDFRKVLKVGNQEDDLDILKKIMAAFYFKEKLKKGKQRRNLGHSLIGKKSSTSTPVYQIEFVHQSLLDFIVAEKLYHSLKEGFLECDDDRHYKITTWEGALNIVTKLFSKRPLGKGITDCLQDIICQDFEDERCELASRMGQFLPDLLERDFFFDYQRENKYPINLAVNTFLGFWIVLSNCSMENDYLGDNENLKNRFAFFLKLSNTNGLSFIRQTLSGVSLKGVILCNTNFSYCNLEGVNFRDADLRGLDINEGKLSKANFFRANLTTFEVAERSPVYSQIINSDLTHCNFGESNLLNANLSGSIFTKAQFGRAQLNGAMLEGANFQSANFAYANLRDVDLSETDFSDAIMVGADFSGSTILKRTKFVKADLSRANFSGLSIEEADFSGADVTLAIFRECKMTTQQRISLKLRGGIIE